MLPSPRTPSPLLACLFAVLLGSAAGAQCTYSWPNAAFGSGSNDAIAALAVLADGSVAIGGRFISAGGSPASRIARWNGSAWTAFGSGADADVYALLRLPNGDLIAGGAFATIDGTPVNCVARWNGTAWAPLGSGVDPLLPFGASVQAIAALPNGDLVIGGVFGSVSGVPCANIARWNGSSWSALGLGCNGPVRGLAVAPNGDLYATGSFLQAGGLTCNGIARWDGSAWSSLGTGLGIFGGNCVAVASNGDVVVGGSFVTAGGGAANRIARWNGSSWSPLGSGMNNLVTSLLALPTGGLLAGGLFTQAGGLPAASIALWDGSTWTALAGGCNGQVAELALAADHGSVIAAGEFSLANGLAAGNIARVVSSCAPSAVSLGAGCTGAGGLNALAAVQLPLIGGQLRALGTGMPPLGFVLTVVGFTSVSLPLSVPFPGLALPGCTLYANPDIVDAVLPVGGTATTAYGFPISPALVGGSFVHQYVPLELDLTLAISAISSSNALQITVGTF